MATQIQNGLVVDIIQTQPSDQHVIQSHEIYTNHQPMPSMHSHQINERNYMDHSQQQNEVSLIAQCQATNDSMHRENEQIHQDANSSVIMSDQDRRLTTAFINYMQKQTTLLNNETPVIVSNKEMNSVSTMNDIEIDNNFLTNLEAQQPTDLSSVLSSKIQPQQSLPPLPPLTPISKMQTVRRTRDLPSQQQIIQYKQVADNIQYLQSGIDDTKQHLLDDGNTESISMIVPSTIKQISAQESSTTMLPTAPKKSLPHKKRITKKLKGISPLDDQIQLQSVQYQQPLTHAHLQQPQKIVDQPRIQIIQTNDFQPSQTISIQSSSIKSQAQLSQVIQPQFACELCGFQSDTQLNFFNHLKVHYEPPQEASKNDTMKVATITRKIETNGIDLSTSAFDDLQSSASQNIFDLSTHAISNDYGNNAISVVTNHTIVNANDNLNDVDEDDDDGHNEASIEHYHDSRIVKSEQVDITEAEYVIGSEVIDMSGHNMHDVKSIIDLNNKANNKEWFQQEERHLPNNIVYHIEKSSVVDASNYPISQENIQQTNTTVIESIPSTSADITQSIIQYELSQKEMTENYANMLNENETHEILTNEMQNTDTSIGDNDLEKTQTLSIKNIQNEFIEEEKTDSDCDALKPNGVRKKKKLYRCRRCDKLCNSKNALHYHFLSHTGERPHQCEICGKSFFASCALKVHKRLHSGDKPYECSHCNRPFRQWGDLKYHIQSKHTTEKNHQCEFCGKDFARRYSLVIHRRIHTGEKNYKCEFCDKQFRASSYLQVHRKIHTGEKPYVCEICDKKFRVRGDLKRHSNIHKRANDKDVSQKNESSIVENEHNTKSISFQMNQLPNATNVIHEFPTEGQNDKKKTRKCKNARKEKAINQHNSEGIINYSISNGSNEITSNNFL